MAEKCSHSDRSLKLKYKVLQELHKGTPQKDLAEKYSILKNTISTWKKNRAKILACYEKGLDLKIIKPEMYENISKALMKWLLHLRSENIPINGLLLKEKACNFAKEVGVSNFQASNGWLEKWKKSRVSTSGEDWGGIPSITRKIGLSPHVPPLKILILSFSCSF